MDNWKGSLNSSYTGIRR